MDQKYILVLDQGTSSSKAVLFDGTCKIISKANAKIKQIYPKPGWVEQNAEEIWRSQLYAIKKALKDAKISMKEIVSIGIANQRETVILWSRETGKPVYNAIVWQCRRTDSICEKIRKESALVDEIKNKTGLVIDPYFSGSKIKWVLDNIPKVREKAKEGELAVGTVDSWLIWNLTGGKVHATDVTNASRTMLFNIQEGKKGQTWDEELCEEFTIPMEILPEVKASNAYFGTTDGAIIGAEIPITGVAGDQQAALFGHACYDEGDTKATYGTGSFLLMNVGREFKKSGNLLTTIGWKLDKSPVEYAFEGAIFMAGAAIDWLKEGLGVIRNTSETEKYAKKVENTNGVYFVPAFAGLGAPYWDMYARGAILGLTRGTKKEHVVRAVLESIAYRVKDVIDEMERGGCKLKFLRVDGGVTSNEFLMQFQADILDRKVIKPKTTEITAQGAAYLAGLGCGEWTKEELRGLCSVDREYVPMMDEKTRDRLYSGWKEAVKRTVKWAEIVRTCE
ncbi:MAG: glycerol kinase GlpK [Thermoplasmata archaeon]